jgi:hypothetical protein
MNCFVCIYTSGSVNNRDENSKAAADFSRALMPVSKPCEQAKLSARVMKTEAQRVPYKMMRY